MSQFVVTGGIKLGGTISVRGAKNAALKLFAAALLTREQVIIKNVPEVEDVHRIADILTKLGCQIAHPRHGTYFIKAETLKTSQIDTEISKQLRASVAITGPLLARTGKVSFPYPGGCVIGKRPIDVFLDGFRSMGALISQKGDIFEVKKNGRLKGAEYFFNPVSVTGTETLLMAAVLAKGVTVLKNCATEPEISALADFLSKCGARIYGAGTQTIRIVGVQKLHGGTCRVIPDRIEAGTFAILAAATNSQLNITDFEPRHLDSLWQCFRSMGVQVNLKHRGARIGPAKKLSTLNIKTHEYPGFPTDLQAPFCVLLTQADGSSLVHETIYEGRLGWTEDLRRMGADILMFDPHRVEIRGPTKLEGKELKSPDLRAGMAYIIAALCAKGETVINNIYQIDRGYEKIEERLQKIGADIKRI